jgi:hypothetical protein
MNERIQELLQTVRKQKHTHNLMSNPPKIKHSYTINEEDLMKFADAIVREMFVLTYDEETRYYNLNDDRSAMVMEKYRKLAKEHFGVK